MTDSPFVLLDDSLRPGGVSLLFEEPLQVVVCHDPEEVEEKLVAVEQGLKRGLYAAGFFAYELGYCLEPKLAGLMPPERAQPLFWIGLYRAPKRFDDRETKAWLARKGGEGEPDVSDLELSWTKAAYLDAFEKVKDYIAAGDVYQINLTLKYFFRYGGDPVALYQTLRRKQRVSYGGLIGTPDFHCLSLSPELFFKREGTALSTRPMKGTAPRGRTPREDARLKTWLAVDEKQRAENLMIVDLLRNDLGRLAKIGSVEVTDLFTVETYRTVHQMTSGIRAEMRSDMGLREMLKALFPSGSVTGAPKVRAMEIIRELEALPRGVYTGAVGTIAPNGDAEFNVAIRTLMLEDGKGEMGIGSGVVADSKGEAEYEECLLKGEFLTKPAQNFDLIETIRWEREGGFYLLDRHLNRLQASAQHFGYPYDREAVKAALAAETRALQGETYMVRLLLGEDGAIAVTAKEIALPGKDTVWTFAVSDRRVDEKDPFFFHKTTRRAFYDEALAEAQEATGCDEVIFLNSKGELTEGTRTNLFIEKDGRLYTPAVACGLLPGTLREEMIDLPRVEASEAILILEDLHRADRIYLGNSVRGLIRAEPVKGAQAEARPNPADAAAERS
ncbi:MAG: aminodeoxychorismate synthase component I [Methyloligella sp. ZOD6]